MPEYLTPKLLTALSLPMSLGYIIASDTRGRLTITRDTLGQFLRYYQSFELFFR